MKQSHNNVDQSEIEKFNALASTWWDLKGESKPLHRINPLRLDYIMKKSDGLENKRILDVGCGGGILTESMAKNNANVTGLDMSADALAIAREHAKSEQLTINYIQQTVEAHAKECAEQYDIVTCMELLEHVPDPESVIASCIKLVKPQGHLFFSTINRNVKAWFMLIVGAEYITKMVPKGTHDAKKFLRPSELIKWIETNNAQAKHIAGLKYHLIGDYFTLSSNIDTNYMLHAQKNSV